MSDYIPNKKNKILINLSTYTNVQIATQDGDNQLDKVIGFGYDGGSPTIIIGNQYGVLFGGDALISVDTSGYPRWIAQYISSNETIKYEYSNMSSYESQIYIELADDIEITEEQYNIFTHFFVQ